MKYTITWCEVKKTGEKNGKPWKITTLTLKDEQGLVIENVDTFDEVINGETIEGVVVDGQYGKNFKMNKPSNGAKPNMERVMEKKASLIGEAQNVKAQNIAAAQDRSEMMWAKNNASILVAHHPAFKDLDITEIESTVVKLANQILHATLAPF